MQDISEYTVLFVVASISTVVCTTLALASTGTEVIFWAIFAINSIALALVALIAHLQGLSYRTGNFKG